MKWTSAVVTEVEPTRVEFSRGEHIWEVNPIRVLGHPKWWDCYDLAIEPSGRVAHLVKRPPTKVFDIPSLRECLDEAKSQLPFPAFGATGGYGALRGNLVDAIQRGELIKAQRWYSLLVWESIVEGVLEDSVPTVDEAIRLFRENLTPLGHEK